MIRGQFTTNSFSMIILVLMILIIKLIKELKKILPLKFKIKDLIMLLYKSIDNIEIINKNYKKKTIKIIIFLILLLINI